MDPRAAHSTMMASVLGPWLAERGFNRSGNSFRRVTDLGDVGLVQLDRSAMSDDKTYWFFIELAVLPKPWLDRVRHDRPRRSDPGHADGLWRRRVSGPAGEVFQVGGRVTPKAAGQVVINHLTTDLPALEELLDRQTFLDRVRQPYFTGVVNVLAARLALSLAPDDLAVFTGRRAARGSFDQRFTAWATDYVAGAGTA